MKTEFQLKVKKGNNFNNSVVKIVNYAGKRSYIFINTHDPFNKTLQCLELSGKSLETFAVNILKALKSKKLK